MTSTCEIVDKPLEIIFCVRCEGSIISKQEFPDQYLTNFGLCSEASKVEKLAIRSRVDVNSVVRFPERVRQYQGEEDSEKHWCKDTSLLHSAVEGKTLEADPSNCTASCIP